MQADQVRQRQGPGSCHRPLPITARLFRARIGLTSLLCNHRPGQPPTPISRRWDIGHCRHRRTNNINQLYHTFFNSVWNLFLQSNFIMSAFKELESIASISLCLWPTGSSIYHIKFWAELSSEGWRHGEIAVNQNEQIEILSLNPSVSEKQ